MTTRGRDDTGGTDGTPGSGGRVQGEGDYDSARRYGDATKRFVEEGRVGPAAEQARTDDPAEQADLERAEQAGRARARDPGPKLDRAPDAAGRREGGSQGDAGSGPDGGGEGGRAGR